MLLSSSTMFCVGKVPHPLGRLWRWSVFQSVDVVDKQLDALVYRPEIQERLGTVKMVPPQVWLGEM